MSQVSFKRITPVESRIFADVYRQEDILNPDRHTTTCSTSARIPEAPTASTTAPAFVSSRKPSSIAIPFGRRARRPYGRRPASCAEAATPCGRHRQGGRTGGQKNCPSCPLSFSHVLPSANP